MGRTTTASRTLLSGVAVTAISALVGAGTVATAFLISTRTMPEGFMRPSTRNELVQPAIQRDSDDAMNVQERRNERLQDNQTVEAAEHESATDEEPMNEASNDRRSYFRAERWCMMNGYANSRRLALCINKMVETGVFENSPY